MNIELPSCVVCKVGQVVSRTEEISKVDHEGFLEKLTRVIRRKPAPRRAWTKTEWHCNACGLCYRFNPPAVVTAPDNTLGLIQDRPGMWFGSGAIH